MYQLMNCWGDKITLTLEGWGVVRTKPVYTGFKIISPRRRTLFV
jgi:hypothetical protein